ALHFPDPGLRRPTRFPFTPGRVAPPTGRVARDGLDLLIEQPGRVAVLGLERATAAERPGVAEKVTVSSEHETSVEEILVRLQAWEDAQARRLDHYTASNITHLRFQPAAGAQTIEAALEGPFFFSREAGADWAWQNLYVNGVRWRGKKLPEIPLIQPEKAAALPLEIHFTREYHYRLRGTGRIAGRDAWVVDFSPVGGATAAKQGKLYQGTVWIDRQLYSRLRTRAVQVGLTGEIISNEETLEYTPVDADGKAAPWSAQSFVLPLHLVAQQILSVVNTATVVERETDLRDLRINGPDFAARRQEVESSDVTMVRDTDQGLRYLVKDPKDPTAQRVVKEGFQTGKLFAIAGVYYDRALSYPLPLAGVNYFNFDYKHSGKQVNIFFAGALLTGNVAEPHLRGSDFDLGSRIFAIAFPFTDNLFRAGQEQHDEEVKVRPASVDVKLGHPLGSFGKVSVGYSLLDSVYSRDKNTLRNFVLPKSNLLQSIDLDGSYARAGYRLNLRGSYNHRSQWDFWGLPGNTEFNSSQRQFVRWDASVAKNWYLKYFQRVGAEIDFASGSHLDRFSKYQFGFFGGTRVHGYRSNSVRASQAAAGHLTYGFEVGEMFRLDAYGDVAFATDRISGLHNELLAGTGLAGSFIGPWETLVNLDAGVPVAGPDHGFVIYLAFLKLL
nr:hypothetical protein [Acidobacteriota bacterium]